MVVCSTLGPGVAAQSLSISDIVGRMEGAQEQSRSQFTAHSITREYQLASHNGQKPESHVTAVINSFAPAAMDFTVRKTAGNDRGEKIVQRMLEHERQMRAHPELGRISWRNYGFALIGHDTVNGHDCYVLQLQPKRQSIELIRGKAWVSSDDFVIRKIEGEPARSPSWWLKDLHLTINYGVEHSMWTQLGIVAVAAVRLAGTYVLTSRQVEFVTSTQVAWSGPSRSRPARRSNAQPSVAVNAMPFVQ